MTDAQLIFDVNYNFAPNNISKLFTRVKDIHNYDTRSSSNENYYSKISLLDTQENSFSRVGIRLWNQIPAHVRNLSKTNCQTSTC